MGDTEPAILVGDLNALPAAPESQPLLTRVVHAQPAASDDLPLVGRVVAAP
ncbi:hypothetical protein [Streptomyces sp. NPDC001070]